MGVESAANDGHRLDSLMAYCSSKKMFIAPALRAQYSADSGLGLRAVERIKPGQRLIDAPPGSLLTTASIPKSFIPDAEVRTSLTVHGLLATWLAFGDQDELQQRYGAWMDTWPSWTSFRDSMPMFWSWSLSDLAPTGDEQQPTSGAELSRKRRRLTSPTEECGDTVRNHAPPETSSPTPTLSPSFYNQWVTASKPISQPLKQEGLLVSMTEKVKNILAVLSKHQDLLGFDVVSTQCQRQQVKFLHMWCCVNTRCFYYVAPGMKPPEDPNEAMALVPFIDLFNHATVSEGASVKYDRKGFHVKADQRYEVGDEVFVQYGKHSNDALWSEYGFVLATNAHDDLDIGHLVLPHLSTTHRALLEKKKYLGNYVVRAGEVCYRTEAAAWLVSGALKDADWISMIEGRSDPDRLPANNHNVLKLKMKRKVVDWMMLLRNECACNVRGLCNMENDPVALKAFFSPSLDLFDAEEAESAHDMERIARARYATCLSRWRQIHDICMGTMQSLERDSPGAYMTGAQDRPRDVVNMDWSEFLSRCRKAGKR